MCTQQNKNRSSTSMVKYDTAEKQRLVLDSVGTKLGISKPEDWYRVTVARVQELGGSLWSPLLLVRWPFSLPCIYFSFQRVAY
jgi:hypothetical protein